ncbi:MAG TPA: tripartite tricarboxylate transporter substrate binding protein [Burkholderiales bacterium]|jgi:tripartite-type tricarboxylate transporter receptor subunit TctC|nr:tripartite tricarboxylate transporter substrate binding protein [Burkholderiales bacterium]
MPSLRVLIAIAALLHAGAALSQAYPAKTVRVIVPFPPGGSADAASRSMSEKLSGLWGQPVVLEHKPGAGTTIAAAYVAASPPDGYTILFCGAISHAASANLYRNLSYDAVKSFAPLGTIALSPFILVVNPGVKATSVRDLIELAKAKPGALNYASSGNGASPHLAAEMLARATGIQMVHVPFKGMQPALVALLAGEVDLTFADVAVMPLVRSGKLKALAVTTAKPSPLVPGVPTLGEAGVAGVEIPSVAGFIAPARTPHETVTFINASMSRALASSDLRERLIAIGFEPFDSKPEEFGAFLAAEVRRYAQVIRDAGITVD